MVLPGPRVSLFPSGILHRALTWLSWLLLVIYFYSPVREVMNPSLDSSNYASYAYFTAKGFSFGPEVVPMAGPYGFVMYGWTYSGHLFALRTCLELTLNGALAALTLWFFMLNRGSAWRWVWLAVHLVYTPFIEDLPIEWILVLGGLFLLHDISTPARRLWIVAVAALLAFVSLIKGTQLVLGFATISVVLAGHAWRQRWSRAALIAGCYVAGLAVFWLLARQPLGNIPAYIRGSLELSSGYNDSMSLEEATGIFVRGVLISFFIFMGIIWCAWTHRRNPTVLAGMAILAGHTFVQWKHGFVRADGHALIYFHYTIVAAVVICLLHQKNDNFTPLRKSRFVAGILPGTIILLSFYGQSVMMPAWPQIPVELGKRFATHFHQLRALPDAKENLDDALARQTRLHAMPLTRHEVQQSSIDLFGFEHGLITLNGLNYRPRPMGGGSFNAYTAPLMQANRAYVRNSATRPDYYLFRAQTIDDRIVTQDDGLTLFDLLYLYRPVLAEHGHLLLKASPHAKPPEPRRVSQRSFQIGDTLEVPKLPANEILLARFEISLSLLGHLRNFLYKVPRIRIALAGEGIEQKAVHRLVPSMAKSPFIFAPLIENNRDWLQLFSTSPGKTLHHFRISTSDRTWFQKTAHVEFFAAPKPETMPHDILDQLFAFPEDGLETVQTIDAKSGETTQIVAQLIHPPGNLRWRLEPGVRRVTFDYGFVPGAYEEGETDGVEFKVFLVRPNQSSTLLLQRLLTPRQQPLDRGNQKADLDLPLFKAGSTLQITTTDGPNQDDAWDWTYLGNLEFHYGEATNAQFPNFNRFPKTMEAELSSVLKTDLGPLLMVHAPAELIFTLKPSDRTVAMNFGFLPGAYTGEGITEGTDYIVEIRRTDGTKTELFRRALRPLTTPADRGPQAAVVSLDEVHEGDELILRTTPGPTGRLDWAWAYIERLEIR